MMDSFDITRFCSDKDEVEFYVPVVDDNDQLELFVIELFDCVESYLRPLQYGLNKYEVIDFLQAAERDLFEWLRYKRYISTDADLLDLVKKYADSVQQCICYRVRLAGLSEKSVDEIHQLLFFVMQSIRSEDALASECITVEQGMLAFQSGSFSKKHD